MTVNAIRTSVSKGTAFDMVIERGGEQITLSVPPLPATEKALGVKFTPPSVSRVKISPSSAVAYATRSEWIGTQRIVTATRSALASLVNPVSGSADKSAKFQGPLSIARTGSNLAEADALNLLEFGAVISLNLGLFNSLPLPGLDGWVLTLLAAEGVLKRRIPNEVKAGATFLAVIFFTLTFLRVLVSDIGDVWQGR
eukprot:gnl/MRDRNA2_/MRDRNA2_63664_c0_seq2.p1 gnl/MRDRNA2_/MRDRNA2_63664_c0~~gnl/MRDRNA2_/MRDRNA2_63664_c0_seq2.p1  ORF type:complete len:197 (+),score=28.79 gnl/MRDRNA2_/MRDRNA2_63664_c0_seq2:112-702(+)